MNYFVTAIHTDSGKTLVSAILTEMLEANYWKPIQSGEPRDTESVMNLVSNSSSQFFKEAYLLNTPASPHASAKIDGVEIDLNKIHPPVSNKDLIIEGAGGVLVPLNDKDMVIDIAARIPCEVILVSNLYLGNINHTLLTYELLKAKGLKIKGLIFNGESNPESERIIELYTGLKVLLRIKQEEMIDQAVVRKYADQLKENW
ncbi:MAG: dethiobiotin synthase [Flammeovirgaceae bacterium]|nr:dethiobiotin synthase [Flammeovirgaceae bacterium]MBR10196.1 dethiobiotin synthase [Rickettsiales bacterium]HCX24675.1 dethiobiotin synthase [Cytophagales bacterium]